MARRNGICARCRKVVTIPSDMDVDPCGLVRLYMDEDVMCCACLGITGESLREFKENGFLDRANKIKPWSVS